MAFFNNKRKDFSIQPPRQQVDGTPFFVTDSANIDFTLENLNLTADLTLTGVTSGTYGSATLIPILQVDQWGRITGVTTTTFSASGIALETNGTPNPVQTLLNLVAGTNMTITDDGLGNITFDATGGGATYTVDNGLTESPANNFQLGGPTLGSGDLIRDTYITNNGYTFRIDQTGDSTSALYLRHSGATPNAGTGLTTVTGGVGVRSSSSESYAFEGISSLDYTQQLIRNATSISNIEGILRLDRGTSGVPFGGIGGSIDFWIEERQTIPAPTPTDPTVRLAGLWENPGPAVLARLSRFDMYGYSNGGALLNASVRGDGKFVLYQYGINTFAGTPTYALGVDASGNVVEYTPTAGGGGGGGRSYYLNGSVIQGTFGGITDMRQMSPVPIIGTGTDFTINTNGYIKSFITDAGDPNKAVIPAGNWNFELWFSVNNPGGSPNFYVELSKYDTVGGTFTSIATSSATPTNITTTAITLYLTALSVPQTPLLLTDRLAVRVFVNHGGGSRVVTLHTQGPHLSQIITDFPSGIVSLNGLTAFAQNFATPGTSGTAPNWSSALDSHTLNIPLASVASVTAGLISKTEYDTFNGKQDALTTTKSVKIVSNNVELDGDNPTPGNDKVYGTNGSGTKGWYNAATGGGITALTGDVTASGTGSVPATLAPNYKLGSCGVIFDGAGGVISTNTIGYVQVPYNGNITGGQIVANAIGSCTIAVKKGSFPPTGAAIITAVLSGSNTAPVTVSPIIAVTAGEWLSFTISGVTTVAWVNLTLSITKTL